MLSVRKLILSYPLLQNHHIYVQVICITPTLDRSATFKSCDGLIFFLPKVLTAIPIILLAGKEPLSSQARFHERMNFSYSAFPVIRSSVLERFSRDVRTIVQSGLINQEDTNQYGQHFY